MKNRWIALLLAAAVVCLPAWLALKLTGADAPAETAGQPVLVTAMARAGAMEETALSAAEPLAAALEQLRADIAETAEKSIHLTPPAEIDLGWWQSHYSDIIGYVYSPGTPISYPIAYDGNNEYYLHHDLYGNYSAYGTIFLDARPTGTSRPRATCSTATIWPTVPCSPPSPGTSSSGTTTPTRPSTCIPTRGRTGWICSRG